MASRFDKTKNRKTFIKKLTISIIILIFITIPALLSGDLFTGGVNKTVQAREEKDQGIVLMEFSSAGCPACRRLDPLLVEMKKRQYPIETLKMEDEKSREFFEKYSITTLPSFVMLVNGQEMGRLISKGEGIQEIQPRLLRMFEDAVKLRDSQLRQSKDAGNKTSSPAGALPESKNVVASPLVSKPGDVLDSASAPVDVPMPSSAPVASVSSPSSIDSSGSPAVISSSATPSGSDQKYSYEYARTQGVKGAIPMSATVRIRTFNGNNELDHGTGTIIHSNNISGNREGLVLTCGHLFRDNKGRGRLEVDVFHPETHQMTTVTGECVYYDAETDIGFVGIPLPFEVKPVALISPNWQSCPGERMISVGCDGGNAPSLLNHELIANNRKFFDPKPGDTSHERFFYLQVTGAPVGGRSGGGLFVERFIGKDQYEYRLAGVCNAGDQKTNEGYFLPAAMIYETLKKQPNLQFVYKEMMQGPANSVNPIQTASATGEYPPAKTPVTAANFEYSKSSSDASQNNSAQNLENQLKTLRQYQEAGAEITCIINWPKQEANNSNQKRSEVIHIIKR